MIVLLAALRRGTPGLDPGAPGSDEPQVQQLVRRAQQGDGGAHARLYELYVRRVSRCVRPLCADDAAAEDVVQDTFVKALRCIGRYRPRPGARFVAWLLTIARNTARRQAARARRRVPTEQERLTHLQEVTRPDGWGADDGLDDEDLARRAAVLQALTELARGPREVLTLRYAAGLSASEVADACGLKEANVRKICQRSRLAVLRRVDELLNAALRPGDPGGEDA